MLRPTSRKSTIVTLTQQIKMTDSNNVLNALFPKYVAHKMKSCLYLSTSPYIHSFSCGMFKLDKITTCVFFKSTSLILVNFQVIAGGKICCFRQ